MIKRGISSVALVAMSALVLTACSNSSKPATESVSTLETDEYGRTVKTTTTREVVQDGKTPPPIAGTSPQQDTMTHIQIDGDGVDGDGIEAHIDGDSHGSVHINTPRDYAGTSDRVHVRAPLVKVDADDDTGSVHIKAPFVNINKNGHGDRTTIKIPGITIRGGE